MSCWSWPKTPKNHCKRDRTLNIKISSILISILLSLASSLAPFLSRSVIFLQDRERKAKAAAAERESLTQIILPNHVQVNFLLPQAYSGGGHRVTCLRGLCISRDTPKAIIRFIRHFFQEYLNIWSIDLCHFTGILIIVMQRIFIYYISCEPAQDRVQHSVRIRGGGGDEPDFFCQD